MNIGYTEDAIEAPVKVAVELEVLKQWEACVRRIINMEVTYENDQLVMANNTIECMRIELDCLLHDINEELVK